MPTLTLSISLRLLAIHSVCSSVSQDLEEGKIGAAETKVTRPNVSSNMSVFMIMTTFLNQWCEPHNIALERLATQLNRQARSWRFRSKRLLDAAECL